MSNNSGDDRIELAGKLRKLLDPDGIVDKRAVPGSEYLFTTLTDDDLLRIAIDLVLVRRSLTDILEGLKTDQVSQEELQLALIRFRLMCVKFRDALKDIGQTKELVPSDKAGGITLFSPGSNFEDALAECNIPSIDANVVNDLVFLVEVQKRRVIRQLREISKAPTAFMSSKALNESLRLCFSMAKDLVDLQMDLGILKRAPHKFDLRVQEAFQTYVDDLAPESKNKLRDFASGLADFLEAEYEVIEDI